MMRALKECGTPEEVLEVWGCLNDFMKETKPGRPKAGRGGGPGGRWVVSAEKTRAHTDVVGVSGSDGSFTAMFPYWARGW